MPKSVFIPTKFTVLRPVENVVSGVLSRTSQFQTVDVAVSENQFLASDFSITNLLSVGAYDILKRQCYVNVSNLNAADAFDNFNITGDVQQV